MVVGANSPAAFYLRPIGNYQYRHRIFKKTIIGLLPIKENPAYLAGF